MTKVSEVGLPAQRNVWKANMENSSVNGKTTFFHSPITPDLFEMFLESSATERPLSAAGPSSASSP